MDIPKTGWRGEAHRLAFMLALALTVLTLSGLGQFIGLWAIPCAVVVYIASMGALHRLVIRRF